MVQQLLCQHHLMRPCQITTLPACRTTPLSLSPFVIYGPITSLWEGAGFQNTQIDLQTVCVRLLYCLYWDNGQRRLLDTRSSLNSVVFVPACYRRNDHLKLIWWLWCLWDHKGITRCGRCLIHVKACEITASCRIDSSIALLSHWTSTLISASFDKKLWSHKLSWDLMKRECEYLMNAPSSVWHSRFLQVY